MAFCTGLDLKEAADQTKAHATAEMVANTLSRSPNTSYHNRCRAWRSGSGGAGIMSACDFVVAAQGTKIGYPEARRGLVAGLVMTFLRRQSANETCRAVVGSD